MTISPKQLVTYTLGIVASIIAIVIGWKFLKPMVYNDPKTDQKESDSNKAKAVNSINVDVSKLRKAVSAYESIASSVYTITIGNWRFSLLGDAEYQKLYALLTGYTPTELKQVYKSYGTRQEKNFGVTFGPSYTLTESIEKAFGPDSNYIKMLKPLFKNTGLW